MAFEDAMVVMQGGQNMGEMFQVHVDTKGIR